MKGASCTRYDDSYGIVYPNCQPAAVALIEIEGDPRDGPGTIGLRDTRRCAVAVCPADGAAGRGGRLLRAPLLRLPEAGRFTDHAGFDGVRRMPRHRCAPGVRPGSAWGAAAAASGDAARALPRQSRRRRRSRPVRGPDDGPRGEPVLGRARRRPSSTPTAGGSCCADP